MWLLATQLSELKCVRIGQDLAAKVEIMAFIRLSCLWIGPLILVHSGLGIAHTTQSALTALVQYLCYPLFTFVVQLLVLESG